MTIQNAWWESDPEQRFWLEITDRDNLGENLLSPQLGRNGRSTPGYELMTHVKPGDIIFHYWQQADQEPAIVSYSVAISNAQPSTIVWKPHGKNSTNMDPEEAAAWEVSLGGMTDIDEPITLGQFRSASTKLQQINEQLKSDHGTPIYFPFSWHPDGLRANQYYLTKFPAELVNLFTALQGTTVSNPISSTSKGSKPVKKSTTSAGYMADPIVRAAIEQQAMNQADALLKELGYETEDVHANSPYDILATETDDEIAVEVKGSSGTATTVELTIGEVNKARDPDCGSMLIVVDQIPFFWKGDEVVTKPGRIRFWPSYDTELTEDRLQPTRFRFLLTPGQDVN